ncbi:hypothetical protein LVD15_19690 [Fulvivirga maritima]|uniref:hypothetical protein n=1 Tax=Fulvivirga maritima TaxID=2904247 RepID=UPI001F1C8F5E|nr:hypothetical protein [Fulvivirga maritima]UII25509.1 hypothetical protein LVD15_19690 [Fulvivirga maritima]
MKRLLHSLIILGIMVAGAAYIYVYHILPREMAKALTSDQKTWVPSSISKVAKENKALITEAIDELPEELHELNLTFDQLLKIVDEVDPDQVKSIIKELNEKKISNVDQTFDVIKKNISLKTIEIELFRDYFKRKATAEQIKKGLQYLNKNDYLTTISVPVAKQTIKSILLEKQDKIEAELQEINSTPNTTR